MCLRLGIGILILASKWQQSTTISDLLTYIPTYKTLYCISLHTDPVSRMLDLAFCIYSSKLFLYFIFSSYYRYQIDHINAEIK
jgi:hypothetical protein